MLLSELELCEALVWLLGNPGVIDDIITQSDPPSRHPVLVQEDDAALTGAGGCHHPPGIEGYKVLASIVGGIICRVPSQVTAEGQTTGHRPVPVWAGYRRWAKNER